MFSHKFFFLFIGLSVNWTVNAYGGQNVDERPRYHVDILKLTDDGYLEHLCNGAILDRNHIITVAHCVHELEFDQVRIRSGSDIAPPVNMPHHEKRLFHRVQKVMYPVNYVPLPCRDHEHDIAILKVDRAFDLAFDELYKQVNLPELSNDYEGYNALISVHVNGELSTFDADVISNEECTKNATSMVTRGNLCAVVPESFNATSGAPLVYDDTLIGFMNAPSKCDTHPLIKRQFPCIKQSATLKMFTRITSYLEFIWKVINGEASAEITTRSLFH
ncbi:hypodermin-A-like [Phymastichus coffea]|uniref:hypodermin-A-like n=1 Tax=Phymastichus coffea TaxID=108790 RepID=UPI00273AE037|nr:hypodermin-A-like [Phymastichus coffea]